MTASSLEFYDYPWSHSLLALLAWGALVGGAYRLARGSRLAAWLLAALVVSHWFLDVLMHRPDVPVFPRGPYVGLGLWNSIPATLAIEGALYLAGLALYLWTTRAADRIGTVILWLLSILLLVLWLVALLGPPPPSERILAISGVFGWLFIAWGYWIDRHRRVHLAAVSQASSVVRR
jgi:hypothetical protein